MATYRVTFATEWGRRRLPAHPKEPHTGNMIAVAHDNRYEMFRLGKLASEGVIESAEWGTLGGLMREAKGARSAVGDVHTALVLETPGSKSMHLHLTPDHSLVSFSTMIAPSPDWFTGIGSVPMLDARGNWVDRRVIPLWAYDAGSDTGTTFRLKPKHPRRKRVPISLLHEPLFPYDERPAPIATLVIQRTG